MEKTANTDAEVLDDVGGASEDTSVTESSSVESQEGRDIDLENKTLEELREELVKEREAKAKAVAHLREQAKKNRPNLDDLEDDSNSTDVKEGQEKQDESDEDRIKRLAEEAAESIVEKRLQQKESEGYADGASDWLLQQKWSEPFRPETAGSDELFAKLFSETKRLAAIEKVTTQEEYRNLLKKAAAVITGRPDSLMEYKETTRGDYQKSMATSPNTSAGTSSNKRTFTQQEIDFAIACGHDPEEVYK